MGWFKNKAIKWALQSAEESSMKSNMAISEDMTSNDTIRFTLTPAVGGRILRVTRDGDSQKMTLGPSNHQVQLYVIPSGEDVGARITKIINMELMK